MSLDPGRRGSRRDLLKLGAAAGALSLARSAIAGARERPGALSSRIDAALASPLLRADLFPRPVRVASVELLRSGRFFLVRARSGDGAVGLAEGNGSVLQSAWPILVQRVAPFFVDKDARELESLLRGVYLHGSNYKWQGLPFWSCVASVELAVLDLLGQVSGRALGDLFGGVRRREIAVYRASGHRGNSPEEEIDYLRMVVAEDGAQAIKFRLGGRMQYDEATTRRDHALIRLTRRTFGEGMALYADANGSYDVPMALEIGRRMQEHGFRFFEEPLPFDHYEETRRVADALSIPIAGGEEEASLRQFRWMIEAGVLQVVQPDIFYFGGMVRSLRVAQMAAAAGLECTPHMSGGGLGFLYAAHLASCAANPGPHQEYKGTDDLPVASETSTLRAEKGVVKVPSGPGLGVVFDPAFVRGARPLEG
ncbi:MAG TPA: mandelate racemase/muconate lactonizing enzyme family protein [Vicinamibacteria bacterium]|nr:mandelate racemase/muconate lactonizing enzyme family protein [Vicinamibacteria bacterium]